MGKEAWAKTVPRGTSIFDVQSPEGHMRCTKVLYAEVIRDARGHARRA